MSFFDGFQKIAPHTPRVQQTHLEWQFVSVFVNLEQAKNSDKTREKQQQKKKQEQEKEKEKRKKKKKKKNKKKKRKKKKKTQETGYSLRTFFDKNYKKKHRPKRLGIV